MQRVLRKSFYVMRHGETTDNARGVISGGKRDPDLTDHGRAQAEAAGEIIAQLDPAPSRIIITDRKRTRQTAEIATGQSNFIVEPGLNERDLGDLDGQISDAEKDALPVLPGAEDKQAHTARVIEALNRQLVQSEGTPLFIGHGGTTRRLLHACGLPEGADVANAQVYHCVPVGRGWKIYQLSQEEGQLRRHELSVPQELSAAAR